MGIVPVLMVGMVVLFIVFAVIGAKQARKRREELTAWANTLGLRFSQDHDSGFVDRYPHFDAFKVGDGQRYAHNISRGEIGGRYVLAFDYHYITRSTDSKGKTQTSHHNFSAVLIQTRLPLRPLSIRPEGFFDKITEFFGMDDIDFESAEFSRRFYVRSPDKRWAYDVLHQEAMEFLLRYPRHRLSMADGDILITESGTFTPAEFDYALGLGEGLLNMLPKSVVRELEEQMQ